MSFSHHATTTPVLKGVCYFTFQYYHCHLNEALFTILGFVFSIYPGMKAEPAQFVVQTQAFGQYHCGKADP